MIAIESFQKIFKNSLYPLIKKCLLRTKSVVKPIHKEIIKIEANNNVNSTDVIVK